MSSQTKEAMKRSLTVEENRRWQPKFVNVLAILKHFEKQGDVKSAEEFFKILRGNSERRRECIIQGWKVF